MTCQLLNKKLHILLAASLCLTVSCKRKNRESNDHIPAKQMEKIMLDVNVAEAYSTLVKDSLHKPGEKNTDSLAVYYKTIFDHYHVTEEQYKESIEWYKRHPDDLDTLFNNISPVVTRWQSQPAKKKS